MASQLRSSTLDCRRPMSAVSAPTSSITALRFVVDANWAKFSIQWIFQCRSCTSIASSSSTPSSSRDEPS
jgi:hypothetical protein